MKTNFSKVAIAALFPLLSSSITLAQSCLSGENYLNDRRNFLSKLNQSKINSDYLIDRTEYNNTSLSVNGTTSITTIKPSEFFSLLNTAVYSHQDTNYYAVANNFIQNNINFYKANNVFPLGFIDYKVKKIKCSAITDGSFTETSTALLDNASSTASYEQIRIIALSPLTNFIVGNNIKFYLGNLFNLSNNVDEDIVKVEIDFGNGEGYKTIPLQEVFNVNFSSFSSNIEIKSKIYLRNKLNNQINIYGTSSTIYRQAVSTVAEKRKQSNQRSYNNTLILPDILGSYPNSSIETKTYNFTGNDGKEYTTNVQQIDLSKSKISYSIIFSDLNNSKKLRKPIIVCDGFDPGNIRNYFITNYGVIPTLENDQDYRGIYHLFNGDPSPWYKAKESTGLIDKLLLLGYDLVIVDYIEGDGNIDFNAHYLRNFLNDVINSSSYRDNMTEEAIMVGPSMGGLITRIALKNMENNGENHYVKQWISFDSPQQGAYIPISLQHSINFLSKIHTGNISQLVTAKQGFQENLKKLNSPAAKQMLLYHHLNTNSQAFPTIECLNFYVNLNKNGLPTKTQNIAITNGGKELQYANESSLTELILDIQLPIPSLFKNWRYCWVKGYRNHTDQLVSYKIFEGSRQGASNDEKYITNSQIPFETAPGGWNSALYSGNFNPGNENIESNIWAPKMKSCFIPSVSALGITPNEKNINTYWNEVLPRGINNPDNKLQSPFDVISGMEENEEHVRISPATGEFVLNQLKSYYTNVNKPYSNDRYNMTEKVEGAVKYKAFENLSFCKVNNNKFIVNKNADVTLEAGKSIEFSDGFSIEHGATLTASINPNLVNAKSRQSDDIANTFNHVDYYKESPFANKKYTNTFDDNKTTENVTTVAPNPFKNTLKVYATDDTFQVDVYDLIGNKVCHLDHFKNGEELDLSFLKTGIYILKTTGFQFISTTKINKI